MFSRLALLMTVTLIGILVSTPTAWASDLCDGASRFAADSEVVQSHEFGTDTRVELRMVRGTRCAWAFASRNDRNAELVVTLERSTDGDTWSQDLVGSTGPGSPKMYARTDPLGVDGSYLTRACAIAYVHTPESDPENGVESGPGAPDTGGACTTAFEFSGARVDQVGPGGESGPGGGDDGSGGGIGAG